MAYWSVPLIAAIANALLGAFVARSGKRTEVSRVFVFLAAMFVLWNLNFFTLYYFDDYEVAYALTSVFRLGAILMPAAALHLVVALRPQAPAIWRVAVAGSYVTASLLTASNALGLFVIGLHRFEWGYYSVAGPLYGPFSAFLVLCTSAALALLVWQYMTARDARLVNELRFWLLGAAVAIPLGLTNLLPAYGVPIYPLGNLGNTAWAAVVAYAIARHRLMDVDVIITKTAAFAISSVGIVLPTFLLVLWSQHASLGFIDRDTSFAVLLALLFVGVSFSFVLQRLEPEIHASLFPEKRGYRQALTAFTRTVTTILDRDRLIAELAGNLSRNFRLRSVLVALSDSRGNAIEHSYSLGDSPSSLEFETDPRFRAFIDGVSGPTLESEIADFGSTEAVAAARNHFQSNAWEVCLPLRAGGNLLGFVALGGRRDMETFSAQDLELLGTLAAEASIALENARLVAELRQSHDLIERADRSSAMGVLAAGIAHEIRNPLVSIQTFFQLAPDRLHDEEFVTTFLSTASGEVRRIAALINELLSFARSPTTEFAPTRLEEVVEGGRRLLHPEARKNRVGLEIDWFSDHAVVWGNFEQIRQVLINLVFNALHATHAGGTVRLAVRASRIGTQECGQIEVSDDGCGIPPEHLESLFDPFFTTKPSGTGLGLAIAHRIVAEHRGRIGVTSELGKGSTLVGDIPRLEPVTHNQATPWSQNA